MEGFGGREVERVEFAWGLGLGVGACGLLGWLLALVLIGGRIGYGLMYRAERTCLDFAIGGSW